MFIYYIYAYLYKSEYINRHTCLAQSASDCAKEIPEAPEKLASDSDSSTKKKSYEYESFEYINLYNPGL